MANHLKTREKSEENQDWVLKVEQYGLKTVAGSDRSVVTLMATISRGKKAYTLNWPSEAVKNLAAEQPAKSDLPECLWGDLEALKTSGEKIVDLWQCSLKYYVPKSTLK